VTCLLVVDDEPAILRALTVALEAHQYEVRAVLDGRKAVASVAAGGVDLVVLDLGLPDISGLEVIAQVRAFAPDVPIVVLSAWEDAAARVAALDLGADDYVGKPFSMPELMARIRVGLRHAQRVRAGDARSEGAVLRRGELVVDTHQRTVTVRGEPVELTRTQFKLLTLFARHPNRVLTHAMIKREVWGDADAAGAENLRVVVSQLRRRIEIEPTTPRLLRTDLGVGYRFVPDDDTAA
jgi:two-component system KDP operon response regulator KdpE